MTYMNHIVKIARNRKENYFQVGNSSEHFDVQEMEGDHVHTYRESNHLAP